jgi:hypothetical protein
MPVQPGQERAKFQRITPPKQQVGDYSSRPGQQQSFSAKSREFQPLIAEIRRPATPIQAPPSNPTTASTARAADSGGNRDLGAVRRRWNAAIEAQDPAIGQARFPQTDVIAKNHGHGDFAAKSPHLAGSVATSFG